MKVPVELPHTGVRDNSVLLFGEGLSRIARHGLTCICVEGIQKELDNDASKKKKRRRGRPTSAMGHLAIMLGVHADSVRRWLDLDLAQACDWNTTLLAEVAYGYDPEGVVKIVQEDLDRRKKIRDAWFKEMDPNYPAPPYVENNHLRPYVPLLKGRPEKEGPE